MGTMRRARPTQRIARAATGAVSRLVAASFITRTLVLGVLTLMISGVAHAVAQPTRDSTDPTSDLVESIVDGEADVADVPRSFIEHMGYTPANSSAGLSHPHGGCSTPGAVGPDDFTDACKTHDLGYDVLRYAESHGTRLSAKARLELDWKLYRDLLDVCDTATCSLTATAYYCAVSANSIRQGYKAPHTEPGTPWMALAVAVFGLSAAGGLPVLRSSLVTDLDSPGGD